MNDEDVVKVLQESREATSKLIAKLEVDNQYRPISNVQIAKYQLLITEIGDAIQYLKKDRSVVCDTCDCVLTPENYKEAHCTACAVDKL